MPAIQKRSLSTRRPRAFAASNARARAARLASTRSTPTSPSPSAPADEAQQRAVERDREEVAAERRGRAIEDRRPARGERRGIVARERRAGDAATTSVRTLSLPVGSGPVPALGRIRRVEREDRAAGVARMQVDRRGVAGGVRVLEHDADLLARHALARVREVVGLHDHHVAGIAAALREQSRGRRVGLHGRHDFEEGVADREHRVREPEERDAGIAEADLEAEHGAEVVDGRLEVARDQRDLAQARSIRSAATVQVSPPCSSLREVAGAARLRGVVDLLRRAARS